MKGVAKNISGWVLFFFVICMMSAMAENNPGIGKNDPAAGNPPAAEAPAKEQDPGPSGDEPEKNGARILSLLDIIQMGGVVGYLIIVLSVVALGLILDYALTLRKKKILPPEDLKKIQDLIQIGDFEALSALEPRLNSFFSKVALAGLKEMNLGYQAMIKSMEDACEALTSGLARKIEHLNVIGNLAPMMGLLGTVTGMLQCFNKIANMPGAIEPKQLAGGIFEALITTCMGLIVAIPSLYAYAIFRNRVDEFTGEAALAAEHMISSFKTSNHRE